MTTSSVLATIRTTLAVDRERLRAAVERVPASDRQLRPAPQRWSVAEVLEHLSLVEGRVAALFGLLLADAPRFEDAAGLVATDLDRTGLRDRDRRITAPDSIQPSGTVSAAEAMAALEQSRKQLLALLDTVEAERVDLSKVSRPHPVLGPLDGYQWIQAVGGHEERHTMQIVEIAAALEGSSASLG